MSEWVLCKDRLPPCNKFVLGYFPDIPWSWETKEGEDVNPKYVVVIRQQGISKAEREALPDSDERKRVIYGYDEDGNNKVPYNWKEFGPNSFFGQECEAWMEIPAYENAKTYKEMETERRAKYGPSPLEQMCEKMKEQFKSDIRDYLIKSLLEEQK